MRETSTKSLPEPRPIIIIFIIDYLGSPLTSRPGTLLLLIGFTGSPSPSTSYVAGLSASQSTLRRHPSSRVGGRLVDIMSNPLDLRVLRGNLHYL